jgi:hypothetical protein
LVVSSDSVVLAGNHTLAAAESLGWDEVDVWRLPVPSGDVRAAEIVAVDNRASDVGGYDAADLLALLDLIGDPGDVGWSGDDLAELTRLDPVGAADVLERDPGRSDALAAPKWLVVVDCGGASEQEALYERLRADGLKVRVAVA